MHRAVGDLQSVFAVRQVLRGQRPPHLFNQATQQHEHIVAGLSDHLEPIAGGTSVPEFEGIQCHNIPEQARLEMEFVLLASTIHRPDGLETDACEVLMTGMLGHLRVEATAAKVWISLTCRTVTDDVVTVRALATTFALYLSHADQSSCHGHSLAIAAQCFGTLAAISAMSRYRSTSCTSCLNHRNKGRFVPPLGRYAWSVPRRFWSDPSPPVAA